jgi:ribosomal protein S18
MANEQNLTHPPIRSGEEAERKGRAGGIASGKSRLRKKRGRELMQAILALKEVDPRIVDELANNYGIDPRDITKEVAMNVRQVDKAIRRADTGSFKAVHQVAGTLDEDGNTGTTVNIIVSKEAAEAANKWCK